MPTANGVLNLRCLVVRDGRLVDVTVGRDQRIVATLKFRLRSILKDISVMNAKLYRATNDEGAWLTAVSTSSDGSDDDNVDNVERCKTMQNSMSDLEFLTAYFPDSPPSTGIDGGELIHVIAVDRDEYLSPFAKKIKKTQTDDRIQRLLDIWDASKEDRVPLACKSPYAPLVIQSGSMRTKLWLTPDAPSSLFIRTPWRRLLGEIDSWMNHSSVGDVGRHAYVDGSPDVGKTTFLAYFFYYLRGCKYPPVIVLDIPGTAFTLITEDGEAIKGRRSRDFWEELQDPMTVYLFDAKNHSMYQPLDRVKARAVMTRSSHEFGRPFRRESALTAAFVVPTWSSEDLRECRRLCYPGVCEEEALRLFHRWGGVVRPVLIWDPRTSEEDLEDLLADLSIDDVKKLLLGFHLQKPIPHSAFPLVAVTSTVKSSYREPLWSFCSQYVCDRAICQLPVPTSQLLTGEDTDLPRLWRQIHKSVEYLRQEEEEKHAE
ncbi:hypothetical protein Poli38472_003526 [Pythium oligandrum]|uniref:Uncharacterized protein n=1 Tax=Pythium oligandrum TaxID=41045 RepID=A0A8K1FCU3_PYTOL|nr:hypothetical protein Poli38472_003526 [Pythium oligandrum]|eukprot:TMW57601.1 hypothetical protein Poli38472_003526 [Pythium oligandrum]